MDTLEGLADELGEESVPIECDVRDTEAVNEVIDRAASEFGGLDVVVNSAGVVAREQVVTTSDEDLDWMLDVNLRGTIRIARQAIPELKKTEGTLILVSSQLGEVGVENAGVYCASKGGINNLARQLAVEHAGDSVTVNALAPGVFKMSMNEAVREEDPTWEERKSESIPLGRLGTPEEITGPVVFLASDESNYMTGHVLVVDGGYIAH